LVLWNLDGRIGHGIGELVHRLAVAVVERNEERIGPDRWHNQRLQFHRAAWRPHAHALAIRDAQPLRRLRVDLDPWLRRLRVEEAEPSRLRAAEIVVDDPPG